MRRCGRCAIVAGLVALLLGLLLLPLMKGGVDAGLRDEARAALAARGVTGVEVSSDWAALTLTGPESARAAALAAANGMADASAVDAVTYIAAGASTPGPGSGPGSSGAATPSTATASAGPTLEPSTPASSAAATATASATAAGSPADVQQQLAAVLGAGVTFDTGSAALTPPTTAILDKVAAVLTGAGGVRVTIAGHTDNQGTAPANLALSEERAESVKNYLVARGVAAARLTVAAYGDTRPRTGNATAADRLANRRIDLTVQGS